MKTYIIETNSRDIAGNIYDTHRSKEYKSFAIAKSYLKEGLESKIIEKETKFVGGKKTVSEKIVFVNNKLTKEKAIAYFNEKAPKALREKGITTIEQYVFEFNKQEQVVFIINGVYSIRYINPEAYNCFMRNQNFKTVLKGLRTSKKDIDGWREHWLKKGMRLVEEADEGEQK